MKVLALKTPVFSVGEDLIEFLDLALKTHEILSLESGVLIVTSKIVSLWESRLEPKSKWTSKNELVLMEADADLGPLKFSQTHLTLKHGLLLPSAGIDESNSETGDYILLPRDPWQSAQRIWHGLHSLGLGKNFGVVVTDSRTSPLRNGVSGIALSYFGFHGIKNQIGKQDLFGRELKMTQINLVDPIASTGVLCMGESDESTPLAILTELNLDFVIDSQRLDCTFFKDEIQTELQTDMYKNQLEKLGLR